MHSLVVPLIAAPLIFAAAPRFGDGNPSPDHRGNSFDPGGIPAVGEARDAHPGAPPAGSQVPAPSRRGATGRAPVASSRPGTTPTAETRGPSVDLTVDFASGSAELTPQTRETLDELGAAVNARELANRRFRIEGHTDTVGDPAYNKALSRRRAEAVRDYLTRRFGVRPARLEAVGVGEAGPLEPTPPRTPDPRNRRVEVVSLGS